MIRSMTGYGKAEGKTSLGTIRVEIRSLNHRFLELNVRLPRQFSPFELRVREMVREYIARGKVDLTLRLDRTDQRLPLSLGVDWDLAASYVAILREAKARFDLSGEPSLDHLIRLGFISLEEMEVEEGVWEEMEPILRRALKELLGSRLREGEAICRDMVGRLEILDDTIRQMESMAQRIPEAYRERLLNRIRRLTEGVELDRERLEQEVAYMADKADITEELVRLKSHIQAFRDQLQKEEPVGRALEFLLQEMNREANTIASKSPDLAIVQGAIRVKEEVEKLREQAQNVE
ncbi:MAG: YicC family protein [Deltaproteobacteria bacterium]|nr:MAG: YicC family protein [Deltaproteobacteria bacterium]